MKSAIFRAIQPVLGKRIHVLRLCAFRQLVRYKLQLSSIVRIVLLSLAMYRDPLTGSISPGISRRDPESQLKSFETGIPHDLCCVAHARGDAQGQSGGHDLIHQVGSATRHFSTNE